MSENRPVSIAAAKRSVMRSTATAMAIRKAKRMISNGIATSLLSAVRLGLDRESARVRGLDERVSGRGSGQQQEQQDHHELRGTETGFRLECEPEQHQRRA